MTSRVEPYGLSTGGASALARYTALSTLAVLACACGGQPHTSPQADVAGRGSSEVIVLDDGGLASVTDATGETCYFLPVHRVSAARWVRLQYGTASLDGSLHCGSSPLPFAPQLAGRAPAVVVGLTAGSRLDAYQVFFGPPGAVLNGSRSIGTTLGAWMTSGVAARSPGGRSGLVIIPPRGGAQRGSFAAAVTDRFAGGGITDDAPLRSLWNASSRRARECAGEATGSTLLYFWQGQSGVRAPAWTLSTLPGPVADCLAQIVGELPLTPSAEDRAVFLPFHVAPVAVATDASPTSPCDTSADCPPDAPHCLPGAHLCVDPEMPTAVGTIADRSCATAADCPERWLCAPGCDDERVCVPSSAIGSACAPD